MFDLGIAFDANIYWQFGAFQLLLGCAGSGGLISLFTDKYNDMWYSNTGSYIATTQTNFHVYAGIGLAF
jgi:hypothetical protein